jgi:hypothetical protein
VNAINWMMSARKVTNKEKTVAMSVAVCHPEWVAVYLEGDQTKSVLEEIVADYNKQ